MHAIASAVTSAVAALIIDDVNIANSNTRSVNILIHV